MRKCKKTLALLLTAALVVAPFAGSNEAEAKKKKKKENVKVSSVKITNAEKKLRLQKGKKFRLKTSIKVSPNKKKYKKLKFTSSNKKVVMVNSKGLLKGRKKGTAKITVASKSNSKKKATISVTVTNDVLVKTIKLNRTKITADEFNEEDIQLKVTKILPSNAKDKDIEWSSDNEDVADVDEDGVVTTGDVGTATITATAADKGGATATCKVVVTENTEKDEDDEEENVPTNPVTEAPAVNPPVTNPPSEGQGESPATNPPQTEVPRPTDEPVVAVTDLSIDVTTDWLAPGDTSFLQVSYEPVNTTQEGVVWTTNDEAVSVGEDGKLKIDENFVFEKEETERLIVVTATSKFNPELSKSIELTIYNPDKIETPDPSPTPIPEDVEKGEYHFTDLFNSTMSDATITAVTDEDGIPCTEIKFSKLYQRAFFELPAGINISDYETISIKGNVPEALSVNGWTNSLDFEADDWWTAYGTYDFYPFFGGSHVDRTEYEMGTIRGIEIQTYDVAEVLGVSGLTKYISIGSNATPVDGFGSENYLIYSIMLESSAENVPDIVLSSTSENTTTPTTPSPSQEEFVVPTTQTYEIVMNEETEAAATKDIDSYRTDVVFNEDGSVTYTNVSQYNAGIVFAASSDGKRVDFSEYDYVEIELDGPADSSLKMFNNTSSWWNKKELYEGGEISGRRSIRYLLSDFVEAGINLAKVDGFGLGFSSSASAGATVTIYSIIVGKVESAPSPTPTSSVSPTQTSSPEEITEKQYYFTDLFNETLSETTITAVADTSSIPCTEINFTKNNQHVFFELPEDIDISKYNTISIEANVPEQLALNAWNTSLDLSTDSWWSTYNTFSQYPYYGGSYKDSIRGIETQEFNIADALGAEGDTRYISIATNKAPTDGFGTENYLIYSVTLKSGTEGVPNIVFASTSEGTVAPSTPTTPEEEIVIPTADMYEIVIAEDNETTATKDVEDYRTDVVFNADGSVSYTNVAEYNSGIVFGASQDGKRVDLSDYAYIDVVLDGPASASLKGFNDASSWWNKYEIWEAPTTDGKRTIRYSLSSLEEQGLDLSKIDGFTIGFGVGTEGETITIYSITAVKVKENMSVSLSSDLETEWATGGFYGSQTYNEDGTVTYSAMPETVSVEDESEEAMTEALAGKVYNNGCAWYMNSAKGFVDISDYSYIRLTMDTEADVKLMTWSGEEKVASNYWDKKDSWGDVLVSMEYDEDGNVVLTYAVDTAFADPTQVQAIGVTLKSCDTDDTVFVEKQAVIKSIEFVNE